MDFEQPLREVALAIARFTAFTAHGLLCGTVVVLLLVFRPAYSGLSGDIWQKGRERFSERMEGLVQASLTMSAVATALALLMQATLVAELRREEIGMSAVEGVLDTGFGKWNALRFPILLTLGILIVSRVRKWALRGAGDGKRPPSSAWWATWFALALVLLITSTFSGHATVASPKWLAVGNDILHMIAASVWFAGIIGISVALPDGWTGAREPDRLRLLARSVTRFSNVAFVSISIVALTGTLNSFLHVGALNDLIDTNYGRAIGGKILLFIGILALGGINHYFVRHRLERAAEEGTDTPARKLFRRTIAVELAIAVSIMGVTGVLTGLARTKKTEQPTSVGGGAQE